MVSIIIPVYNVESYIERCLLSVIKQSYEDIEVILVNDCSTDNSMTLVNKILSSYEGPIKFFIITHDTNRGLSAARNTGITNAHGDYLFFLDSDDYISNDCIRTLYDIIADDSTINMVFGNVEIIKEEGYSDDKEWIFLKIGDGIYSDNLMERFINKDFYVCAWNRLISKKFIIDNNLFFEEGLVHEDHLWSFNVACHLDCIAITTKPTYYYFKRNNSLDSNHDKWFHNIHYSHACTLQNIQALESKKYHKNLKVFQYIEIMRVALFKEAYYAHQYDICKQHYKWLRDVPNWSPLMLARMKASKQSIARSFHQYLPPKLGYEYYIFLISKSGY